MMKNTIYVKEYKNHFMLNEGSSVRSDPSGLIPPNIKDMEEFALILANVTEVMDSTPELVSEYKEMVYQNLYLHHSILCFDNF